MNPKTKFLELSEPRRGVMFNCDLNTDKYIKKRHMSLKDQILRKVCKRLLNVPKLI